MSAHREILASLERLKSGAVQLTSEQYLGLLEAVEQAAEVLLTAPKGHDPVANGIWYHHERTPAITRLADALNPAQGHAAPAPSFEPDDKRIAEQLRQSLLNGSR